MSCYERWYGTIKEIGKFSEKELEKYFENKAEEDRINIKSGENYNSFTDFYLECDNKGYYRYYYNEDTKKLYDISNLKEINNNDEDWFEAEKTSIKGAFKIHTRFYNGGCGIHEAIDYCLKNIK